MQTIFNVPESAGKELEKFKEETDRFRAGKMSATEYRALRVPMGIYEQREEGTFMLRARVPAGGVLPHQMRTLAAVARRHGDGILHVTTRQDIQVHRVLLDQMHAALVELSGAGLSTKGGGGNTVRNVTACADAGVCEREAFDVAPYCVALTEFLVADPLSFQLPRKYKIAFSGCAKDCSGARVQDLGFVAKRQGGALGFAVCVGGGMGAHSRLGDLLEEFVPKGEAHLIAEAVKRVFDRRGNRKDRHKARLRFLLEKIGLDRFRELYAAELALLRKAPPAAALNVRDLPRRSRSVPRPAAPQPGFTEWRARNVAPQKQAGYHIVHIPLPLGDISSAKLEGLTAAVETHGEGMARTTQSQNLVVRWVHEEELTSLHRSLAELGLATPTAPILRNIVSCTGAATCKLGFCLSRGLAGAITDELVRADLPASERGAVALPKESARSAYCGAGPSGPATALPGMRSCSSRGSARAGGPVPTIFVARPSHAPTWLDLDGLGELEIHVSGCPNSCGRHPIAHLGFFGVARRVGGRLAPHYVAQVGGGVVGDKTRLAEGKEPIPARKIPAFVIAFLRAFQASPEYPDYEAFLSAGGRETAQKLAAAHQRLPRAAAQMNLQDSAAINGRRNNQSVIGAAAPAFEEDKTCYYDWGADVPFSLAGRGEGQCSAGVFDMIEVDLKASHHALGEGKLFAAAVLSARALLVTQGQEARTDADALRLFSKYFLDPGHVSAASRSVIEQALRCADAGRPETFRASAPEVGALLHEVQALYDHMDPSLRFPSSAGQPPRQSAPEPPPVKADLEADFQDMACPLNYARTKLLLEQMEKGQVLSVLLSEEGARSVPASVERDGHAVLSVKPSGERWQVTIRKS